MIRVSGIVWFANIDHGRRHQPLSLMTMADNLKLKKPQDASRINMGQKYEIDYWTKSLNTSELKLFFAVLEVTVIINI